MKRYPWLGPSLLALVFVAYTARTVPIAAAHDGDHPPVKVADEDAHRPTPLPDRIILTWSGDPRTTQAVSWRTSDAVAKAYAEVAEAEDGPLFQPKAKRVEATTTPLATNLGTAHYHSAGFADLKPGTQYVYRVGDGANWSEWMAFRTASDAAEPFSFVYFGDAQNDVKSHWSRVVRESFRSMPKARFFLHAGDLINRGNSDAEWGEWHQAGGWLNGMVPSLPVAGNHEYSKLTKDAPKGLTAHWGAQFALPENGPEGLKESVYFTDFQGVRLVVLNSNERHEEQASWLGQVLGENPNRWTIVSFHHPVYSSAKGRDNPKMREQWQPIFDRYKVDLVLQGHDHTYARSGFLTWQNVPSGATVRDAETGTVYVVSVSGPKHYNIDREPWMHRAAEDTQLFQVITVDGDTLSYKAMTATGRLYDAFDLKKWPGEPNRLVDKIPSVPENRRPPASVPAAGGGR